MKLVSLHSRRWHTEQLGTGCVLNTIKFVVENGITKELFLMMTGDHIREIAGDLRTAIRLTALQKKLLDSNVSISKVGLKCLPLDLKVLKVWDCNTLTLIFYFFLG